MYIRKANAMAKAAFSLQINNQTSSISLLSIISKLDYLLQLQSTHHHQPSICLTTTLPLWAPTLTRPLAWPNVPLEQ